MVKKSYKKSKSLKTFWARHLKVYKTAQNVEMCDEHFWPLQWNVNEMFTLKTIPSQNTSFMLTLPWNMLNTRV